MIVPTAAALVFAQYTMLPPTMIPPQRYDHAFNGRVDKLWLSPEDTSRICTGNHPACTFSNHPKGACRIYINAAYRGTSMESVLVRHEVAHCNGWPANHPR